MTSAGQDRSPTIASVVAAMQARLATMPPGRQDQAEFLGTYQRTTEAVAAAVRASAFEDPGWWRPGTSPSRSCTSTPWMPTSRAPAACPDRGGWRSTRPRRRRRWCTCSSVSTRTSTTTCPEPCWRSSPTMTSPTRASSRAAAATTSASTASSRAASPPRTGSSPRTPRAPCSTGRCGRRIAGARSGSSARREKRCGTTPSSCTRARLAGPEQMAVRLAELELLSAARVADLLRPGQVLLRLAVSGFGVVLPPAADPS